MKGCESEDPVEQIRETVAQELARALSLKVLEPDRRTKAKTPDEVIKDYPGADLILDIRTSRWGIQRVRVKSAAGTAVHFAVAYAGSLRLIDARKSAVIAEATCTMEVREEEPPTMKKLLADDCALLNEGLGSSAETCAKRYRSKVLGLE